MKKLTSFSLIVMFITSSASAQESNKKPVQNICLKQNIKSIQNNNKAFLIPGLIGSGILTLAGIGAISWAKIERNGLEKKLPCHTNVECKMFTQQAANSVGLAYASIGLFFGAGISTVSTLTAWKITQAKNIQKPKVSFMVVPSINNVQIMGNW
jgi:hypothetical protein